MSRPYLAVAVGLPRDRPPLWAVITLAVAWVLMINHDQIGHALGSLSPGANLIAAIVSFVGGGAAGSAWLDRVGADRISRFGFTAVLTLCGYLTVQVDVGAYVATLPGRVQAIAWGALTFGVPLMIAAATRAGSLLNRTPARRE